MLSHAFTFSHLYSYLIHTRTRITPMRKTKILLSVLGAPSKALAQQGRLINRDVHLRAEIVRLRFLKGSIDSRSYPLSSYSFPDNNVPNWRQISLRGWTKERGRERGNKRLQPGPSDMHTFIRCPCTYTIYNVFSLMSACAYILNNNNS